MPDVTVSVIMPTHNRSDYLSAAIDSVLKQTYRDIELIVIDDGSTDNTHGVLNQICDSRLVLIKQTQSGRSAARNKGIQFARGRFIAFLDDDDLYLPTKIECQVHFLERNQSTDLVGCGAELINSKDLIIGSYDAWNQQPHLSLHNCIYSCPLIPSTIMIRRNSLAKLDCFFDKEVEPAEDKDFFLRLLIKKCTFSWLPKCLVSYRIHNSNSQNDGIAYHLAKKKLLSKLFSDLSLPNQVMEEKEKIYCHYYLGDSALCYATGQLDQAKEYFKQASVYDPHMTDGHIPDFVTLFVAFSKTFHVNSSLNYLDFVFDNLPIELNRLKQFRNRAVSAFYMQDVFESTTGSGFNVIKTIIKGIWFDPNWILNWGVWVRLFREFKCAFK